MVDPAFFPARRSITVDEIAELTGARITDPSLAERSVQCVAQLDDASEDALVYMEGKRVERLPAGLKAAAILCEPGVAPSIPAGIATLETASPRLAFAKVAQQLYATSPVSGAEGISSHAHVHGTAVVEDGVTIEPGAVIGAAAEIGRGTTVGPNTVVGAGCKIGRGCQIGPGCGIQATLMGDRVVVHGGAQIGADGFGFVPGAKGNEKVPQLGRVIIQDDVEIGANTTIDRGAISDTVIGAGTKIDNLVQIGHNTKVGRNCLIAAQTGISGTVVLGDHVMLAGQVGIGDHVTITDGVQVAAQSGIVNSIRQGGKWGGTPALPMDEAVANHMAMRRLLRKARKDGGNG